MIALGGCAGARFQPVYVGDVAYAFLKSLDNDAAQRQHYSLCGPECTPCASWWRTWACCPGIAARSLR